MLNWLREVHTRIIENTTRQSGPTAARYRWRAARAQIALVVGLNLATWVTICGVILGESTVIQIGLALLFVPTVSVVAMLFLRHRYFTSAGKEFGLKVTWRHPVPIEEDRFRSWCTAHGVTSYADRDLDRKERGQ